MRYFLIIFLLFLSACEPREERSPVAVRINEIEITVDEFNDAYANAYFAKSDGPMSKEEFLDTLITRRLMLKEAEYYGLDKDEKFLKSVEFFWQQSLLKLVIEKKLQDLSVTTSIEESEIREYYEANKESFGSKTYEQKRERIKYMLMREKQQKLLQEWMDNLSKTAELKINKKLLDIK